MNLNSSSNLISYFFCWALLLQCLEMVFISRKKSFLNIWSFENLAGSLPFKKFFQLIYSEIGFQFLLLSQLIFIVCLVIAPASPLIVLAIALIQLLICIRFRGLFNGGSDMMVFVIATGLIIGGKLGLIYITIHTCYSYFKAGLVKIVQPTWRSGVALGQFLGISLYPKYQNLGKPLGDKKILGRFLSYLVLAFELLIPLIFVFPKIAPIYFMIAIGFHIVNCMVFGLNRFLWIWLAAWPAVLYSAKIIKF